jgi:hypothetical protein
VKAEIFVNCHRDSEPGGAAFSRFTFDADLAFHYADELRTDAETEPYPSIPPGVRAIRLDERVENRLLLVQGYADTSIGYAEAQCISERPGYLDVNNPGLKAGAFR